jgi:D-alanyl-D-alanine carboxypeptidase
MGLTPRYSAIVIEANSGQVLEQEGADQICHPASLTKMMTLYMIFEALKAKQIRMDTQVPVSLHAARQIPSKLGLRPGEYVSIETIIKALVTKSANDASAAIAEYLGGSESNFAIMMTRKAKSLNMRHTVFKNASGVPNPQQVTTARDMAILSRSLYLHFPKDCHHFRLRAFHHRGRVHRNHNHLLGKALGSDASIKVEGIKTGFVNASGFNLAASAVRVGRDHKPMRLIAVVLGGPNRHWRDRRVAELLEGNFV